MKYIPILIVAFSSILAGVILGASSGASASVEFNKNQSSSTEAVNTLDATTTVILAETDSLEDKVNQPEEDEGVKEVEEDTQEQVEVVSAESKNTESSAAQKSNLTKTTPYKVPFYSQFNDISAPEWRKIGCGIASLAMLIDFYTEKVTVDTLLKEGIASNAYLSDAGWSHAGLINLAKKHGLTGQSKSLASLGSDNAFAAFEKVVEEGPVMVSVHYTFEPTNPIPHLVVVNGVSDGLVYYNDPAEPSGGGSISVEKFRSSWKQRYIEIRPVS